MLRTLGFGLLFGFLLSRVGATDFDTIASMFLLTDLHLFGVMGLAMVVAGLGMAWFRARQVRSAVGLPMTLERKPMKPGLIVGGLIFGAGWALTGTCPGTALAQLGEGKLTALATIAGILAGTALYRVLGASLEARLAGGRARGALERPTTEAA
ncbi:MAG: YeeE/YedE family protein [Deltaproteobacteria bacterium]|nr:YeeE/YedE family protein [Deltaproteobacteria bacterium]MCB9787211.1 YeeE/YedE family protein [Deltaproteobacteria bacterium]